MYSQGGTTEGEGEGDIKAIMARPVPSLPNVPLRSGPVAPLSSQPAKASAKPPLPTVHEKAADEPSSLEVERSENGDTLEPVNLNEAFSYLADLGEKNTQALQEVNHQVQHLKSYQEVLWLACKEGWKVPEKFKEVSDDDHLLGGMHCVFRALPAWLYPCENLLSKSHIEETNFTDMHFWICR